MKLLRRLYSKRDFGEPTVALLADALLIAALVAGALYFLTAI